MLYLIIYVPTNGQTIFRSLKLIVYSFDYVIRRILVIYTHKNTCTHHIQTHTHPHTSTPIHEIIISKGREYEGYQ